MKYYAYTDGSSRGNPGPSGWSALIMNDDKVREYSGAAQKATNNQMEICGVLYALNFSILNLNKLDGDQDEIEISSDSQYTVKGCNEWVYNWSKNNWKTSQKKEVLNKDLWQEVWKVLNDLKYKNIKVTVSHIKGHSGHAYNERADQLCTAAATKETIEIYTGSRSAYDDFLKTKDVK